MWFQLWMKLTDGDVLSGSLGENCMAATEVIYEKKLSGGGLAKRNFGRDGGWWREVYKVCR